MQHTVEEHGFTSIPRVLSDGAIDDLLVSIDAPERAGRRGLLRNQRVRALAGSESLLALVRAHLPTEPVAVRAIYFDKAPEANWLVPWHQDLTIAVATKVEVAGFGPWSIKDGIPHVQPPVSCLENMLTVRLHFDYCDTSNGFLKVIPKSHRSGKLSAEEVATLRTQHEEHLCIASAGDALLM